MLVPTNIDEPLDLDALTAVDQVAMKYIEHSKAMEAVAIAAPSQGPSLHLSGTHLSAVLYVGSLLLHVPEKGC